MGCNQTKLLLINRVFLVTPHNNLVTLQNIQNTLIVKSNFQNQTFALINPLHVLFLLSCFHLYIASISEEHELIIILSMNRL